MTLLEDILDDDLKEDNRKIHVQQLYQGYFDRDLSYLEARQKTPKVAIYSLADVYELIGKTISDYEKRAGTAADGIVTFTEEMPDKKFNSEIVSVSCVESVPGSFSRGSPGEGKVKNLKFIHREEIDDPDHPGYRISILGYVFEHTIRLTCWAKTNKAANRRVDWLYDLMIDYDWYFCAEGINRMIFLGRRQDEVLDRDGIRWYGRPLDYFVRCEKIKMLSERAIEEMYINLTLSAS